MKRCRGCRRTKGERSYAPDARTRDGLSRYCTACGSKRALAEKELRATPKRCRTCRKVKAGRFFPPDQRTRDGLSKDCLVCTRIARSG